LALTSPTCGGRSVGIVRLQTKATEFVFVCYINMWAVPSLPVTSSLILPSADTSRSKPGPVMTDCVAQICARRLTVYLVASLLITPVFLTTKFIAYAVSK
jgi:hypothetical protein